MNRYTLAKAGIDVKEGIHRFNDSKECFEKYLTEFAEDEHYNKLLRAISEKNAEAAFQAAHALKGASGNVSLTQLYEHLVPLVEELRAGRMDKVPELIKPVQESYERVMEALEGKK